MSRRITIRDIPWMRDAEDDHKSNWHADSKGGHRHNYLKNAKIRQRERSKELRNFWRLFTPLELPKSIKTSTTTAERGSMR